MPPANAGTRRAVLSDEAAVFEEMLARAVPDRHPERRICCDFCGKPFQALARA
jgi:hypothetical protein